MKSDNMRNIGIVGGGVIGLSIGWQLARRGAKVTIYERGKAGRQTSWVSAGMLAPFAEVGFEEIDLMHLGEQSLEWYPSFLDQLKEDADEVPSFDQCGTLLAGVDRDDMEILQRLYKFRDRLNLQVERMTGTKAREFEPLLSPTTTAGIWLPDDAQINQRSLIEALKVAFRCRGGTLLEQTEIKSLETRGGTVHQLISADGKRYKHDTVCLASGVWTNKIDGIPESARVPLRPVKGQILSVHKTNDCDLNIMVRTPRVYLVPKGEDGPIVIGATSEEQGFDMKPTAGGIKDLLDEAWDVVPSIYDLPLKTTTAGLRPAARDNAPVIGAANMEGLYYATGHYRSGILYTPVTAFGIVKEMLSGDIFEILKAYRPSRFKEKTEAD